MDICLHERIDLIHHRREPAAAVVASEYRTHELEPATVWKREIRHDLPSLGCDARYSIRDDHVFAGSFDGVREVVNAIVREQLDFDAKGTVWHPAVCPRWTRCAERRAPLAGESDGPLQSIGGRNQ